MFLSILLCSLLCFLPFSLSLPHSALSSTTCFVSAMQRMSRYATTSLRASTDLFMLSSSSALKLFRRCDSIRSRDNHIFENDEQFRMANIRRRGTTLSQAVVCVYVTIAHALNWFNGIKCSAPSQDSIAVFLDAQRHSDEEHKYTINRSIIRS